MYLNFNVKSLESALKTYPCTKFQLNQTKTLYQNGQWSNCRLIGEKIKEVRLTSQLVISSSILFSMVDFSRVPSFNILGFQQRNKIMGRQPSLHPDSTNGVGSHVFGITTKQRLLLWYTCEIPRCYCQARKLSANSELRVNSADFEEGENDQIIREKQRPIVLRA